MKDKLHIHAVGEEFVLKTPSFAGYQLCIDNTQIYYKAGNPQVILESQKTYSFHHVKLLYGLFYDIVQGFCRNIQSGPFSFLFASHTTRASLYEGACV